MRMIVMLTMVLCGCGGAGSITAPIYTIRTTKPTYRYADEIRIIDDLVAMDECTVVSGVGYQSCESLERVDGSRRHTLTYHGPVFDYLFTPRLLPPGTAMKDTFNLFGYGPAVESNGGASEDRWGEINLPEPGCYRIMKWIPVRLKDGRDMRCVGVTTFTVLEDSAGKEALRKFVTCAERELLHEKQREHVYALMDSLLSKESAYVCARALLLLDVYEGIMGRTTRSAFIRPLLKRYVETFGEHACQNEALSRLLHAMKHEQAR